MLAQVDSPTILPSWGWADSRCPAARGTIPKPLLSGALMRVLRLRDAHQGYQACFEAGEPPVEYWFFQERHILAVLDPAFPVSCVSDWFDMAPKRGRIRLVLAPLFAISEAGLAIVAI